MEKDTKTVKINDNQRRNLDESVSTETNLKGHVEIFDKLSNGSLKLIDRQNLIVYQGREWLLRRAFHNQLLGSTVDAEHTSIKWFGVGTGGGEAGNPLQAGATRPWDTDLSQQVRVNPDGATGILPSYAPKYVTEVAAVQQGWYKKFASVIRREDHANPYVLGSQEFNPELIAEIRIELSDIDTNGPTGATYYDINEAALFIASETDPTGTTVVSGFDQDYTVDEVTVGSGNDINYVLSLGVQDTGSPPYPLNPTFNYGDYVTVSGATHPGNDISVPTVIKEIGYESSPCRAYITVENAQGAAESIPSGATLNIRQRSAQAEMSMFSRVTFSSIRKTSDREIVFIWKIYF